MIPIVDRPTWLPASFAAASADVSAHRVAENHYTELKRTYENKTSGNRELAKDIAALALDGGVLVIGIDEDVGRAAKIVPQDLTDFAERVESVARYRCDPPVHVIFNLLSESEGSNTGILVVEVPAHPMAPVMADGRYYGRGERQARTLSDAEVVRLHQARTIAFDRIDQSLTRMAGTAAARLPGQHNGVLTVVCEPAPFKREGLMTPVYQRHDWRKWLQEADKAAAEYVRAQDVRSQFLTKWIYGGGPFSPLERLSGGINHVRQPDGVAAEAMDERLHGRQGFLRLDESGSLNLAVNKIIDPQQSRRIFDWYFTTSTTLYLIGLFQEVCRESGLGSTLDVGVQVTKLADAVPMPPSNRFFPFDGLYTYQANEYKRTTRVTVQEMEGDLASAIDRLWGPLLRAMGLGDYLYDQGAEG